MYLAQLTVYQENGCRRQREAREDDWMELVSDLERQAEARPVPLPPGRQNEILRNNVAAMADAF
jgi:hypothetical protein